MRASFKVIGTNADDINKRAAEVLDSLFGKGKWWKVVIEVAPKAETYQGTPALWTADVTAHGFQESYIIDRPL